MYSNELLVPMVEAIGKGGDVFSLNQELGQKANENILQKISVHPQVGMHECNFRI